jgi:hypothetical protein
VPRAVTSVLYTSALEIPTDARGAAVDLVVVNVGGVPANGTLEIFDGTGAPLTTVSYNMVAPGVLTGTSVSAFTGSVQITTVYGRVTVRGRASSIRASLLLRDVAGLTISNAEAR